MPLARDRKWGSLKRFKPFRRAQPTAEAWERLASQMGGLVKGCSLDRVTRLVHCLRLHPDEGRDIVSRLAWEACHLDDLPLWLRNIEKDQLENSIGPRSLTVGYATKPPYDGATSMEDIVLKFFTKHETHINTDAFRVARDALFGLLDKASLKFDSVVKAALDFKKRANCGWPWFVTASVSPLEYLNEAEKVLGDGCNSVHASAFPGALGTRTDIRGRCKFGKSRVIYGCSRVLNIIWGMAFGPAYTGLYDKRNFVAWQGQAATDRAVTRIMKSRRVMYSIDFKGFDYSVPSELVDVAFDAIAHWFEDGHTDLIEFMRNSFKYTGLFVPGKAEYYHGTDRCGGISSGSKLTNLLGSLINFFIMHYCAARTGCRVVDLLTQGDDALVTFEGSMTKQKLAYYIERDFGMRLSTEKTLVDRDQCSFLQMNYHRSYRLESGLHPGVRSIIRSLGRMMSREHAPPVEPQGWSEKNPTEDWADLMDAFRAIQQVDYCAGHPMFEHFAAWTADHTPGVAGVLQRVINNDVDLLAMVDSLIKGDPVKTRVTDLYHAAVVKFLTRRSWS